MKTVLDILKKIAAALITEKVIKSVVLKLLKHLAANSKNTLDDEIIREVEQALIE